VKGQIGYHGVVGGNIGKTLIGKWVAFGEESVEWSWVGEIRVLTVVGSHLGWL